jgi:predicted ATPase/class 3 adenylate cyclase
MNAPFNLIPQFIDERFAAGQREGSLDAVTLYMDMSGFTAMTQAFMQRGRDGAETLSTILNKVFSPIVQAVYEQKGFITGFAGDAFTALFPLDEPLRACAAALTIHHLIEQEKQQTTPFGEFTLAVRMGLSVGKVVWGIVGPESQRAYFFRGRGIERCALAEAVAQSGDVIVDYHLRAWMPPHSADLSPLADDPAFSRLLGLVEYPPVEPPTLFHSTHQSRFFPILRPEQIGQGEFREAVIVFISFTAGLPLTELDQFMSWVIETAGRWGGHFNEIEFGEKGGVLLLYFGAPVAHERDPERALNFLLELQHSLEHAPIAGLQWRAGVAFGLVFAGMIGAPLFGKYTCLGSIVNLAARQVMEADWGQIVVAETVAQQVDFSFTWAGEFIYKGFDQPATTYRLLGRHSTVDKFFTQPMVGREAELNQLMAFARPLWEGRFAGVIVLYGEAGMGKSHLTYTLHQICGETVSWFIGQSDAIVPQAFSPFVYWLRRYFAQLPEATPAENRAAFVGKLEQVMAQLPNDPDAAALRTELSRTQSILGALLGHHWPGSLYETLDAPGRYRNTIQALKTLILTESRLRPVVLELEDAHWLDEASRELLTALTRQVEAVPLLIVLTSRYYDDGARPQFPLAPDTPLLEMALNGLSAAALTTLAETILHHPITPTLHTILLEKSQANPFFAQQLLTYFHENGLLTLTPQGWTVETTTFTIPTSINAILMARIDRLAGHIKEVVKVAAVLGREFEVRILSQMLQTDVLPKVQEAQQEQIWMALSEWRYLFKHTLLRDAAYEMQLRSRLRELHGLAAVAYEQVHATELSNYYPDLVYHYGQAQMPQQECTYAIKAGEHAAAHYANREAIAYFNRALALIPPDDQVAHYDLLWQRERVYDLLGEREAQWQDISRLLELTAHWSGEEGHQRRAEAQLLEVGYVRVTKNYAAALDLIAQLAERVQGSEFTALEARIYNEWSEILLRSGEHERALRKASQALNLIRQAQEPQMEALFLNGIGNVLTASLNYREALVYIEEALYLRRQLNDRHSLSISLLNLGGVYSELGEPDKALACYEECLQLKQETGELLGQAALYNNLGNLYLRHGELARGQHYFEQALHLTREVAHRRDEAIVTYNLGYAAWSVGDEATALAWVEQSLQVAQEIGLRIMLNYGWNLRGRVLIDLNRYHEAHTWLEQALQERQAMHLEGLVIETQAELADLYRRQGGLTEAHKRAETVISYLQAGNWAGMEDPFRVYGHCWHIFSEVDEARARVILHDAYEKLQATANRIQEPVLRQNFLFGVPSHRHIVEAFQRAVANR